MSQSKGWCHLPQAQQPFPAWFVGAVEKGPAGATCSAQHSGIGLLAFRVCTLAPHSVASVQRVPGGLSPGPAVNQQHQRLCGDAVDGTHHRVHVRVDLFGLMWAQQLHEPWQNLQHVVRQQFGHMRAAGGVLSGLLQMYCLFWGVHCPLRSTGDQSNLQGASCESSTSSSSHLVPCCPLHFSLELRVRSGSTPLGPSPRLCPSASPHCSLAGTAAAGHGWKIQSHRGHRLRNETGRGLL